MKYQEWLKKRVRRLEPSGFITSSLVPSGNEAYLAGATQLRQRLYEWALASGMSGERCTEILEFPLEGDWGEGGEG